MKSGFRNRLRGAYRSLRYGMGYAAANMKRWARNYNPSYGSPDGEILQSLETLRVRSRDLYKNNAIGGGALDLLVGNVVGRGLKMQSVMNREVIRKYNKWTEQQSTGYFDFLERKVETSFDQWASSLQSDYHGEASFYENQALAFLSVLQSGEVFMTHPMKPHIGSPYRLRVGLIEADQVQTPIGAPNNQSNRDGIETTVDGTPIAYWVNRNQEQWPQEMERVVKYGDFSGRQLIYHLFKRQRPGQSRGVPLLARCTEEILKMGKYKKSELTRAEVSSFFTAFITTESGALPNNNGIVADPAQTSDEIEDEGVDYTMGPGMIMGTRPGEDVKFADPSSPNTNYDAFITALMREIGMALGIPFEMLVRHFTASFTASRAARVEFQKVVNVYRDWFTLRACKPTYKEFFIDEVLSGRIYAPGFFESVEVQHAFLGSMWAGEAMGMIDPAKEVQAAFDIVKAGFSTMTKETAQLTGNDYPSVIKVQERERKIRQEAGIISELDEGPEPKTIDSVIDKKIEAAIPETEIVTTKVSGE